MPVTLDGPPLPAHTASPLGFCAVCAAAWKAAAFVTQAGDVQAADKTPNPVTIRLAPEPPVPWPPPAVAWGLAAMPVPPGLPGAGSPAVAPLPLCWTHLQAVQFTSSGLILANGAGPGPFGGGVPLDRPH